MWLLIHVEYGEVFIPKNGPTICDNVHIDIKR